MKRRSVLKFLIVNQHTGNYGDDLAGVSLVQQILNQFSKASVDIMYRTPKGSINYFDSRVTDRHDLDIGQKNRFKFLLYIFLRIIGVKIEFYEDAQIFDNALDSYDLFIVSPAGANIGIYKDWLYLLRLFLIVKSGHKLIFHGNTIGQSDNLVFNWLSRYVLRRSLIYSRETRSTKFLASINISAVQTVDTAFLFNRVDEDLKFNLISNVDIPEKFIVFIPTELGNWHPDFQNWNEEKFIDEYILPEISKLTARLSSSIVILPHLHGLYAEQTYLKKIVHKLEKFSENNVFSPEINDFTEYNYFIANASFVVSMRYHGVVMSIYNHIPFISLSYENKMAEVCNYSGFSVLNHNISNLSFEKPDFYDEYKQASKLMKATSLEELDNNLETYALAPLRQIKFLEDGSNK